MDINAIQARAEAATSGPWESKVNGNTVRSYGIISANRKICSSISTLTADAEFIAHAREDIPALLAEVKRLQKELDAAKAALRDQISQHYTDSVEIDQEVERVISICGQWKKHLAYAKIQCSECGVLIDQCQFKKYCPNCGAKMKGE